MRNTKRQSGPQSGAALIIAIFSLMLISVVATTLILTAGTETAIKTNYKSAMAAFYDAKAGLEEARGRLWTNNPNSAAILNCVFPGGATMASGQACYIINPANGETIDPTNPTNTYADVEYQQEWGGPPPAGATLILSTSPTGNIAGPLYKWVRITPRTEASAKYDSDSDNSMDITRLFFDGQNIIDSGTSAGPPPPSSGQVGQVLTITSFAATPNNSHRMVQYTVAPAAFGTAFASFPSALTLDGNTVSFTGPGTANPGNAGKFQINGNDLNAPAGTPSGVPAIGFTNSNDASSISASAVPSKNYLSPSGVQNLGVVTLPPILQSPTGLNSLVQSLTQNADLVLNPSAGTPADQTSLPAMSATNPVVVVVNGDFNLHGYGVGYGLLVVTGTLDYDPDASWNGVILVIGKGAFRSSKGGTGGINGAVFIAQTNDSAGNPLATLGSSSFTQTGGGAGIHYSSSWIKTAMPALPFQVLSFREIAQTP